MPELQAATEFGAADGWMDLQIVFMISYGVKKMTTPHMTQTYIFLNKNNICFGKRTYMKRRALCGLREGGPHTEGPAHTTPVVGNKPVKRNRQGSERWRVREGASGPP